MAITATKARYISLDNKTAEIGTLVFGEIRLGGSSVPKELATEGDLAKIERYLTQVGHSPETAAAGAQQAKDFYSLGADCLWVTFARGHLWWTFADPEVIPYDFQLTEEPVRRSIGGWSNTDTLGVPLKISEPGDRVKRFADRPTAQPDTETLRELLQLINGLEVSQRAEPRQPAASKDRACAAPKTQATSSTEIPSTLFTVPDVAKTPSAAPNEAGVYAWWFDELPDVPLAGAREQNGFRLAYIGIASYRPGSRRTLRQRLRNHCNGPIATSTLRRSLAAILIDELGLHPCLNGARKILLPEHEEARLSNWLAVHGRVAWLTHPTPWTHEAEILRGGPPLALNILGNAHEFVPKLRALRRALSDYSAVVTRRSV